jgi:hypothetical protein
MKLFYKIYEKKKINLFFIIIFLYIFIINTTQVITQHWTAVLDQDTVIIYNSLLVASGYDQEYRDHPGYTYFFFLGIIYKICTYLYSGIVYDINYIINYDKINHHNFQTLFYIARYFNSLIVFLILIFYYKVSKILKINIFIICTSIILIIASISFYPLIFLLRNEGLSLLFFLISFLQLLKFFKDNQYRYLFYAGFYYIFAMLSKIQIIFLFMLPILMLPPLISKKKLKDKFIKLDKIFIIQNFALFFSYLIFQILLIIYARDEQKFYYDLFFVIFFLIFYLIYAKYLIGLTKDKFLILNKIIAIIFIGASFAIFFLKIFDFLNIIKLSNFLILRLTNPLYYLSVFSTSKLDFFILKSFNISEILFTIFILIFSFKFLVNYKNTNKDEWIIYIVFLISILGLILSNLLRKPYFLFTLIIMTIFLNLITKKFNFKKAKIINIIFIIIFFLNTITSKSTYEFFNTKDNSTIICKDNITKEYMRYWHKKFDDFFLNKFCN